MRHVGCQPDFNHRPRSPDIEDAHWLRRSAERHAAGRLRGDAGNHRDAHEAFRHPSAGPAADGVNSSQRATLVRSTRVVAARSVREWPISTDIALQPNVRFQGQSELLTAVFLFRKSTSVRSTRMISQHPNRHVLLTKLAAAGRLFSRNFIRLTTAPGTGCSITSPVLL